MFYVFPNLSEKSIVNDILLQIITWTILSAKIDFFQDNDENLRIIFLERNGKTDLNIWSKMMLTLLTFSWEIWTQKFFYYIGIPLLWSIATYFLHLCKHKMYTFILKACVFNLKCLTSLQFIVSSTDKFLSWIYKGNFVQTSGFTCPTKSEICCMFLFDVAHNKFFLRKWGIMKGWAFQKFPSRCQIQIN